MNEFVSVELLVAGNCLLLLYGAFRAVLRGEHGSDAVFWGVAFAHYLQGLGVCLLGLLVMGVLGGVA
jgi:hypothetical protein